MRIGIIGGGASGMMAAIAASRYSEGKNRITLIEKNDRIGKKILATGNGRCNFTNLEIFDSDYNSQRNDIYTDFISQFDQREVISFFQKEGMLTKDRNGYCYPRSDQASTVLDILRRKLSAEGVEIRTDSLPVAVTKEGNRFRVAFSMGADLFFDRIILACGSFAGLKQAGSPNGYDYARGLGHTLVPVVPALVQLRASRQFADAFKAVAGVRCDARITLHIDGKDFASEAGELQLTDYGISGIPVFQLSRHAAYGFLEKKEVAVSIDFLPEVSNKELVRLVRSKWESSDKRVSAEDFFLGMLNKKLNLLFIRLGGLKAGESIGTYSLERMMEIGKNMKAWRVDLEAANPYLQAQVCAGGVSMNEITLSMESVKVKGLFFAGEMLDVDGRCGGFNLQWAWSSGYLAGKNAVIGGGQKREC